MDNCLSSGASELLHSISTNIVLLQKSLSNTLFATILDEIADQINRILFEDLVLKNTFNEFGAKQLYYDLSIGFMSLFRLYMARPQLHFAKYSNIYSEKIYFCVQTILMVSPFPLPLPLPQQINLFFVCFLILGKYNNFFGFYAYFSTINNPFLWNQCSLFRSCINFYCELCSKLLAKYIIDLTPNLFCFSNKYFFRLIYKKFYLLSSELWMR